MKKLMLVFAVFLSAASLAQAQDKIDNPKTETIEKGDIERMVNMETQKLHRMVNLTKDQRARIMKINRDIAIKQAHSKATGKELEMLRTELDRVRTQMYMEALTDQQMARYRSELKRTQQ